MSQFWDTSAILALILQEVGAERLEELNSDGGAVVWWGSRVEAVSGLYRWHKHQRATADDTIAHLLDKISQFTQAAYEVQPTEEVRDVAGRMLRLHELRAADALQLAAALVWAGHHPAGIGFVCLDRRLRHAAAREGFEVFPA